MSQLLAILDGGGDTIEPTAYERSKHQTLDSLTQNYGLFYSISPMVAVGSDVAHLHIFGGNPHPRGVFEALGIGQDVDNGETAYKCILACYDGNVVTARHPKVSNKEGHHIIQFLQEKLSTEWSVFCSSLQVSSPKVSLRHYEYHRFVLVVSKETMYENDPKHDGKVPVSVVKDEIMDHLVVFLSECLQKCDVAKKLAVNYALLRGPSSKVNIPFPVKALLASDAPVIRGIGHCMQHTTVIHIEWEAFGTYFEKKDVEQCKTQLKKQLRNDLEQYDLIILHFEKPDFYSHQGDIQAKAQSIELSDFIIKCVWEICDFQQIIVTSDHTTSCETKQHSIEPVPIAIWRKDSGTKGTASFNEKSCADGNLGVVHGSELLEAILDVHRIICDKKAKNCDQEQQV